MGTPSDLPLAIPRTGPPAVPTPAGGDPVPMDDVVMSQPVVAYFTFIQNNLNQLTGGHAAQVIVFPLTSPFLLVKSILITMKSTKSH